MFGRYRRNKAEIDRDGTDFVTACEMLLAGRYVEEVEKGWDPVPAWAWMNLLAHGAEDLLQKAANERPPRWMRTAIWRRARTYLASEVLDAAEQFGSLAYVQSQVLVPLELELLTCSSTAPRSPGTWVVWVVSAIDDLRTTHLGRG